MHINGLARTEAETSFATATWMPPDFAYGSKMRRTRIEHMSAGLPLKPDIARRGWHGRKVPTAAFAAVRRTGVTECSSGGSLRLDACELDHLGPLLGFVGDELAEVGRRERKHCAT